MFGYDILFAILLVLLNVMPGISSNALKNLGGKRRSSVVQSMLIIYEVLGLITRTTHMQSFGHV